MEEKGVVREQKAWKRREREKNASAEQEQAEVGLLAKLLSKLRAANKGGNSLHSFLLKNALNGYMLTPRGQRGEWQS